MNDQRANRLIHETSPYLLQHAHNPVDWHAWGPEALDKARAENRPILLSIGYSACHWCHVMERESFEDEQIAALMNEHFVNIKVDREERPDLDHIYQTAVQLFTGQGGWPLTMFLTPDQEPFYGGTYFPPDDRYGRPGFPRLLRTLADAYHNRQQDVVKSTSQIRDAMQKLSGFAASGEGLALDLVTNAVRTLANNVDMVHGGFGTQPKFPTPPISTACCGTGTTAATKTSSTWSSCRWTKWPAAAFTTNSAAAFTAIRWTTTGWCRTSRRCCTTTPSCCRCTPPCTGSPARRSMPAWRAKHSTTYSVKCAIRRAASTPPRTPTARAKRASFRVDEGRGGRAAG